MLRIERCLIDANWGSSTDVIYQFCRQSYDVITDARDDVLRIGLGLYHDEEDLAALCAEVARALGR